MEYSLTTEVICKTRRLSNMSLSNFKTNTYMKVNGMMIVEAVGVYNSGRMDPFMKDTGRIISQMAMED